MEQEPLFDDPSYESSLSEIQASTRNDDDYEDPTPLLDSVGVAGSPPPLPPPTAEAIQEDNKARSLRELDIDEALLCDNEAVPYSFLNTSGSGHLSQSPLIPPSNELIEEDFESDSSSGEAPAVPTKPTQIRQSTKSTADSNEVDEKLYIVGDLVQNRAPVSFKSRMVLERTDSSGSLQEQGIYQGLVMTDAEKQRLGILPESIYMTANLEQWGEELEHLSIRVDTASEGTFEVATYQVPTVTFPRDTPAKVTARSPSATLQPVLKPISPKYRGSILRPPPLPPLDEGVSRAARKVYAVVENLLKSEAAFLTSLNIAIEAYMKPLTELAQGPSPVLDRDQVEHLFGPISQVICHHELFYAALTSRTMEWTANERIGDVFVSSFNRKEVIKHYSKYVNNFTKAMDILEKAIKKKPKFVTFLRKKYNQSKTSLSLQGLLLKPIQRFPQYILFLQDLLRYTHTTHPDKMNLQMALARFEGIADYLNESKRQTEQHSIVQHLNNKVTGLPFKLMDSKRWLHRQDVVTRLMFSQGRVVQKQRSLLLFNNMVLCASLKRKPKKGEVETSGAVKDFQVCEGDSYSCKWFSPLDKVEVVDADYQVDIWDYIVAGDDSEDAVTYRSLKSQHKKLEHDFITMTKITALLSTLNEEYRGLSLQVLENHIRVLQRELARIKEKIKQCQIGRVDILIPSREGDKQCHHTYLFQSEKVKRDWLKALRCAKLQMKKVNANAWVYAEEEVDEDDYIQLTQKLPLLVDEFPLMVNDTVSVECATKVGSNGAWFASGNSFSAQVTVVQCMTHCPLILECFTVDSSRIMAIISVPDSSVPSCLPSSLPRDSNLDPHSSDSDIPTVWMGTQCGKILIYSASNESSKTCISSAQFTDSITAMVYYEDQVFVSTADGNLLLFQRMISSSWDLNKYKTFPISQATIKGMCTVGKRLWIAVGSECHIFNMKTHKVEGNLEMSSDKPVTIKKMTSCGAGVWVSFRDCATLELYHSVTRLSLQQIDIKGTLTQLIARYNLEPKLSSLASLHITSLMASSGYLWIGTSIGVILIYKIPLLEGVPLVSGKPHLAMDGHREAVRVLLTVKTMATVSSTRVSQFMYDERARNISFLERIPVAADGEYLETPLNTLPRILEDGELQESFGFGVLPSEGPSSTLPLNTLTSEENGIQAVTGIEEVEVITDKENTVVTTEEQPLTSEFPNGTSRPEDRNSKDSAEASLHVVEKDQFVNGLQEHPAVKEIDPQVSEGDEGKPEVDDESKPEVDEEVGVISNNEDSQQQKPQVASSTSMAKVSLNAKMTALQNDDSYSYPTELDTFKRLETPDSAASITTASSHEYDGIAIDESYEIGKAPSPYEDPATLEHTGPVSAPEFFSPVDSTMPSIPGRSTQPDEGAVYVLTAGRGLINLRPGRRRSSVLFPSAGSASLTSVRNEGCMIAYEIF